jgi:hypothetical protein
MGSHVSCLSCFKARWVPNGQLVASHRFGISGKPEVIATYGQFLFVDNSHVHAPHGISRDSAARGAGYF